LRIAGKGRRNFRSRHHDGPLGELLLSQLNGEAGIELLKPAGEERLRMWPVSRRVNKTGSGDDDPTLLDEVVV